MDRSPFCELREGGNLYAAGRARLETVFNAGVLVLRLDVLRQRESLLLEGIRLLAEQDGAYKFYDNDILISLFSERYTHLPWRYNVRLNWDMAYGLKELVPAIYHCLGRNYSLEGRDPRHRLFLDCYRKTPWFEASTLHRGCLLAQSFAVERAQQRLRKVQRIFNVCCRKQRVFVGLARDEARLRQDFALGGEEPYLELAPGDELRLPYPVESFVAPSSCATTRPSRG